MSVAKSDLDIAQDAVLRESVSMPADAPQICGYDFNKGIDFAALMDSYLTTGFQATNLAKAIQVKAGCDYLRIFQDLIPFSERSVSASICFVNSVEQRFAWLNIMYAAINRSFHQIPSSIPRE